MNQIAEVLDALSQNDANNTEELLVLVYDDLRRLASQKLASEAPGNTLQATALVHEAFLRLSLGQKQQRWDHRGHFFVAAAQAMQRILVERARQKVTKKRGADAQRGQVSEAELSIAIPLDRLIDLDEALLKLAKHSPEEAKLVQLRYFAGMTIEEAAETLGITRNVAYRYWKYAKAYLTGSLSNYDDPN